MSSPKLRGRIFYGWWVVLACAVIQFYVGGTFWQGFTALFDPIANEFGWSYALVSLAFTFRGFESGVLAPVIGVFVDRFGPRRLLLSGIVIMGLGFLFFSQIHALWSFYVAFLILALGMSFVSGVVPMAAVAAWFRKRTSRAMGVLTAGFGAAGLLVPAVVWFTDRFGWREALVMFGVGMWLLGIPLALVVKQPQGEEHSAEKVETSSDVSQKPAGLTIKGIIKGKDFWLFSMALFFGGVAGPAVTAHQIPYLVSVGISRQTAGFLTIVLSLSNILGRLGFGWLGDIFEKRYCFAIAALIKGVGVLGFALSRTEWQFIPSLIALGIGFGGLIPLRPALQVELYSMKSFATVQGLLMVSLTVGSMISPVFAGWMFDFVTSYRPAFVVLAVSTFIAVPLILTVAGKTSRRFATQ